LKASASEIVGLVLSCVFGMPVITYIGLYARHFLQRLLSPERRTMTVRSELMNFASYLLAPFCNSSRSQQLAVEEIV
jgi:hypothetical protein